MKSMIEQIKEIVEVELSCSAHNFEHILRVYGLCEQIALDENDVDMDILLPAVLLHDIARVKEDTDTSGKTDHSVLGAEMAEVILLELNFTQERIDKIKHCIISHRFRSGNQPETIEAKILFDADKLDVLGSVGIARTYMMSGTYGQKMKFDEANYKLNENSENNGRLKDMSKHSPFIEFEYKYKKIPERLFTKKAKEMAVLRLEFMSEFFRRLKLEIDGKI